jgi:hypothetical protein
MSHRNLLGVNEVCSEHWSSLAGEHIGFMAFPVDRM